MKKNISSMCLLIFVGYLWWGFVYPEFSFLEGTYEVVEDSEETEETEKNGAQSAEAKKDADAGEDGEGAHNAFKTQQGWCSLLQAEPEKIVFSSKIVRKWMQ